MKIKVISGVLGLALVIGGSYAVYSYNDDKAEAASTQEVHKVSQAESDKAAKVEVRKVSQAELDKAAKDMGEMKKDDDFYYTMITLALQKLEFKGEDESYHLPGTADVKRLQVDRANLQYLKNRAVEIKAAEPYQKILDKWLEGDFSNISNDYLTIRNIKDNQLQPNESPVLKVRTAEGEEKYIKHFFGDEGLQINKRDWQ
jgi:hypothetical protein